MKEQVIRQMPPVNLNKIVDYIWVVYQDNQEAVEDIIMPLGHNNVIINIGSDYYYEDKETWYQAPPLALVGQIQRAKKVKYGQVIKQMGIALTPLGFKRLLGNSLEGPFPTIVDLNQLEKTVKLPIDLQAIKVLSQRALTSEVLIDGVYQLLEPLGDKPLSQDDEWIHVMYQLINNQPAITSHDLLKVMHVSMSTLERFFKKYFGMPPKKYIEIIKFKHYMLSHQDQSPYELTEAYYDQSHLIKKSKKYTGKTAGMLSKPLKELTLNTIIKGSGFKK